MYFYTLTIGTYDDYREVTLSHEIEFNKEQFGEMFNKAVDEGENDNDGVADYLVLNHGFQRVIPTILVTCEYGSYRKLTDGDYKYHGNGIDAEDKSWRSR